MIEPLIFDLDNCLDPGKGVIKRILDTHGFSRERILIIEDSQLSEIKVAEKLGIRSVQTLRPGASPAPNATYRIQNVGELPNLLESLDLRN